MDWDRVEGNWKQTKGKVKEKWGQLTDDDLTTINGKRDQLEGKIQERYGLAKDMVRKDVDDWLKTQDKAVCFACSARGEREWGAGPPPRPRAVTELARRPIRYPSRAETESGRTSMSSPQDRTEFGQRHLQSEQRTVVPTEQARQGVTGHNGTCKANNAPSCRPSKRA